MKNWRTTVVGVAGAVTALALAKGWIDEATATCVGAVLIAIFGAVASDAKKPE